MAGVFKNDKSDIMIENNSNYSVLIIGIINHGHNQRLVKHLRSINPQARIDFLASSVNKVPRDVIDSLSHLYVAKQSGIKNSLLGPIIKLLSTISLLKSLKGSHYDVISIQSAHYYQLFYIKYIRKLTSCILLTPWGSDIYRIKGFQKVLSRRLFKACDMVTIANNKFGEDVKKRYNLSPSKTVCLDIGSDAIDYIIEMNDKVSQEQAKEKLGVSNSYVITCSYNGLLAHRHELIIDAIKAVRDKLPTNLVLFFPFTYCATEGYAERLKSKLDCYGLRYVFFEEYLSVEDLFLMRKSADMFVHIQPTDANSQSLQEYLLCGAKVVNGEWLRYKELEINETLPYFTVRSLESVDKDILRAFQSSPIDISKETIDYIKSYGWKAWIVKWDAFFKRARKLQQ